MESYAKALAEEGHEVTIFTANALAFRKAHLPAFEMRDGIRIRRFTFISFPTRYAFISPHLLLALLKSDVDVFQVFSLLPSFFILAAIMVAKVRGIRLVLYPQFHPSRFQFHPSRMMRTLGGIFDRTFAISLLKMADYVIALTYVEQHYYTALGIKNVTTIYEWIPFRKFATPEAVRAFRTRLDIDQRDRLILFVGRVERRKGLDILVKALPLIAEHIPDVKLIVVGKDWGTLGNCISIATRLDCLDRLVLAGEVAEEELSAAYSITDVVVVPSLFEAYGRTVVEAWTFKKPVIVSSSVALSELVTRDNGIVVSPGAVSELADATSELLLNPKKAREMGERGKLVLDSTMLDLPVLTERLLGIYQPAGYTPTGHTGA